MLYNHTCRTPPIKPYVLRDSEAILTPPHATTPMLFPPSPNILYS